MKKHTTAFRFALKFTALLFIPGLFAFTACSDDGGGGDTTPESHNSSLFVSKSEIGPGPECANGGVRIDMGFDVNRNNVLDPEEVTNTEYVCHGEDASSHPFVVYTWPTPNEMMVSRSAKASVVFNTEMDPSTVTEETLTLSDENGIPVVGTVEYDDITAVFTPDNLLAPDMKYTVTASPDMKNALGTAMGYEHRVFFYTFEKYAVVYHANGATVGTVPAEKYYADGSGVTVAGNPGGLAKTGSPFIGWCTAPDGTGTCYGEGETINISSADVHLHARWGQTISLNAINGVTPPVYGETPVTTITETDQYTGTVSWNPTGNPFAATTVYTATITLTAKTGYTLTGVTENFFTVAGATSVTNSTDSGVVTAIFPATGSASGTVIYIAAIPGVTAPALGATPVTTITETAQYTGTVTWNGGWAWSPRFGGQKVYTATITLTAKSGYTLTGVAANFFTVAGTSTAATNSAGSGVVTAVFPATASVGAIGASALGGKVAYILQSGDTGYVAGEQRGLIAADSDQSSGIIWAVEAYQLTEVPGGTGLALGTGSVNTDRIIAQNGAGETYAAGLARAHNGGGFTDWYLPSRDELNKLYYNRDGVGGFADNYYWSSSEYFATNAWGQIFGIGYQNDDGKHNPYRVRAVRAF